MNVDHDGLTDSRHVHYGTTVAWTTFESTHPPGSVLVNYQELFQFLD
jgi:hypothetical protein